MNAKNFYIAEYDAETHRLFFPYFVDEYDQRVEWLNPGHGLTAYVLRTGQPLLATPEVFERLVRAGRSGAGRQPEHRLARRAAAAAATSPGA